MEKKSLHFPQLSPSNQGLVKASPRSDASQDWLEFGKHRSRLQSSALPPAMLQSRHTSPPVLTPSSTEPGTHLVLTCSGDCFTSPAAVKKRQEHSLAALKHTHTHLNIQTLPIFIRIGVILYTYNTIIKRMSHVMMRR